MRDGDIKRDPLGGVCSEYCTFQPICRLERALGLDEETKDGDGERRRARTCPHPRSRPRRSRPATATSSARPAPAAARRACSSGRYCDAICDDGVEIDEILAFTFTERAAAELRQRIRRELSERSRAARAGGDELAPRAARTRARETERAWVTTIHGFCRRLLGTHPVAAGLDPRFRVLDAPEAGRLRERAAREAIERLVAGGDERVARVTAAYRTYRVSDIVLAAHERLRSQGMARPSLPEVGLPGAPLASQRTRAR